MTEPRRLVARVLQTSDDHPDVMEIHRRAKGIDPNISAATVYRSVKLFEDLKLVVRHRFGDGPARYELAPLLPHDHLIDVETGQVIEFRDPRIDAIQARLAEELGYDIVSYRLEIFALPSRRSALV
ncbi:transcriptional repressor [Sphingobium sp. SA2]|uniref:Fur family transcriptional regulator n=1 Tax=Sphingobium sp. SA2 TaxID=1524832 RepID=UPI0028C20A3A|nr:transcriptional repressor [Sphingobium sp. SA2]MDT7532017.1 transcriptional repressor [Sphingobium sp. SA2]